MTFSRESYYAVLKGMVRKEDIGFGFKDGLRYRNIVPHSILRMRKLNLFQREFERRPERKLVPTLGLHCESILMMIARKLECSD